jgi:pyridoxine kinase
MSKITVIYWSGSGNTEAMAEAVAEGAKAQGLSVRAAVKQAKTFITAAIGQSFPLNSYVGPTYHAAHRLEKQK